MGCDAFTRIVVGIEPVPAELPPAVAEAFRVIGEYQTRDGLCFTREYVSDYDTGTFGVTVLYHDWDYGKTPFDAAALHAKIDAALPKVAAHFKEWGLPEPRVLLTTGYM